MFISDIEQTSCQLNYCDVSVLNLKKMCTRADVYITLYLVHGLDLAVATVRVICQET